MVLINQVLARTLTTFGFRYRIISVKLLVFRVKVLPLTMHFFYTLLTTTSKKVFVPTSMTLFYNFV